ncbi:MAG: cytochrome c-type biogenesis CcmF C-terminal domain-containing protein, partial [Rubrivivax sp.]|nr:cytochrome c-type biogenesis CcmF C-terminal domain-containing protein [Rubrivivax sp.]
ARRLRWAFVFAVVAALATGWAAGRIALATTGGLFLAWWIVAAIAVDLIERLRPPHSKGQGMGGSVFTRARMLPRAWIGMTVAHLGIALFAFGVTMVRTYEVERDVQMGPDSSTELAGYQFRMVSLGEIQGPNYRATQGQVEVTREGALVATLLPEKRIYRVQTNPMTESGVHSNLLRDIYVSMGEPLPGGEWIVRVQYKPFINWIWIGCLVMMLGGGLAASDRRYRARQPRTQALTQTAGSGASAGGGQ